MTETALLRTETCVKQGDQFLPLEQIGELKLDDPNYVDGSIRVFAGRKPLITDAEWTDIVDWWGGVGNVIRDLVGGAKQVTDAFPDCPVEMRFQVAGGQLTWEVDGAETRRATFNLDQALRALIEGYHSTFERLKVLNPAAATEYDALTDYLKKAVPTSRMTSIIKA